MIKNYLKVALRTLLRNKVHTVINMAGLSVGLACSLFIMLWVQNEYSIDAFHKNVSRLYTVYVRAYSNHKVSGMYITPGILASELKKVIPDMEYATNMGFGETSTFQAGNKTLKVFGNSAGADYFKMFSYRLLQGDAQNALNSPVSIAISRKMAGEFFGSPEAAIGKMIRYQNSKNFTVTAVFDDLPKNVSQTFDFLTNWDAFLDNNQWARQMGNFGPPAYVMLRSGANAALVNKKIAHFLDSYYGKVDRKTATSFTDLALQPYRDTYLFNRY